MGSSDVPGLLGDAILHRSMPITPTKGVCPTGLSLILFKQFAIYEIVNQ
jgi:hypothetical protein